MRLPPARRPASLAPRPGAVAPVAAAAPPPRGRAVGRRCPPLACQGPRPAAPSRRAAPLLPAKHTVLQRLRGCRVNQPPADRAAVDVGLHALRAMATLRPGLSEPGWLAQTWELRYVCGAPLAAQPPYGPLLAAAAEHLGRPLRLAAVHWQLGADAACRGWLTVEGEGGEAAPTVGLTGRWTATRLDGTTVLTLMLRHLAIGHGGDDVLGLDVPVVLACPYVDEELWLASSPGGGLQAWVASAPPA